MTKKRCIKAKSKNCKNEVVAKMAEKKSKAVIGEVQRERNTDTIDVLISINRQDDLNRIKANQIRKTKPKKKKSKSQKKADIYEREVKKIIEELQKKADLQKQIKPSNCEKEEKCPINQESGVVQDVIQDEMGEASLVPEMSYQLDPSIEPSPTKDQIEIPLNFISNNYQKEKSFGNDENETQPDAKMDITQIEKAEEMIPLPGFNLTSRFLTSDNWNCLIL